MRPVGRGEFKPVSVQSLSQVKDIRPLLNYDTLTVPSALNQNVFTFFATQSASGLDRHYETAMMVPTKWVYEIHRFAVDVNAPAIDNPAVLDVITYHSVLKLTVDNHDTVYVCPIHNLGTSGGVWTPKADSPIVNLGLPSAGTARKLPYPIVLTGGKPFTVTAELDLNAITQKLASIGVTLPLPGDISIRVLMEGLKLIPVA